MEVRQGVIRPSRRHPRCEKGVSWRDCGFSNGYLVLKPEADISRAPDSFPGLREESLNEGTTQWQEATSVSKSTKRN